MLQGELWLVPCERDSLVFKTLIPGDYLSVAEFLDYSPSANWSGGHGLDLLGFDGRERVKQAADVILAVLVIPEVTHGVGVACIKI